MLVTGTLVYGKGDKLEAKREGLLEAGEEHVFAPVATALPGETQPSAVPGQRRPSAGTAPIAMRATPGSLKVCCQPRACPTGAWILPVTHTAHMASAQRGALHGEGAVRAVDCIVFFHCMLAAMPVSRSCRIMGV